MLKDDWQNVIDEPTQNPILFLGSALLKLLDVWAQRVGVNGIQSSWRAVTHSVFWTAVLEPVLFNFFIHDLVTGSSALQ